MSVSGSCLCGAVRFTCAAGVGPAGYCHCADCRKCTGSAFNVSVPCPTASFRIEQGDLGSFTKTGTSGSAITRHFCRGCGSPVYTSSPRHVETVYVKAGLLDDPSLVMPVREAWTRSRVAWSVIPADIAHDEAG